MMNLFDHQSWGEKRWEYLDQARKTRDFLMDQKGRYRYQLNDERLHKAIWFWVSRARIAHAIAMGRQPVIQNFTIADGAKVKSGPIYARPVTNPATLITLGKLE